MKCVRTFMSHPGTVLKLLLAAVCVASFSSRAESDLASVSVVQIAALPPTSLSVFPGVSEDELERAKKNGLKATDLPSIGSGLARVGSNEFVGITDRGPNFNADDKNGKERRIFPLPKFAPAIVRFKIADGKIEPLKYIPLRDEHGKLLTGLSNDGEEEDCYESANAESPLPSDVGGIDPEGIRVFPDGRFLVSEEYSPSLLVVNTNGQVLVRYTPSNKSLTGAPYPVKPILPRVFSKRRDNRGFECVALSPDGKTAYAMLQSAVVGEKKKDFKDARISRIVRLDMSDPLNARVTGHFLVPIDPASSFSQKQNQQNVKLNDAEWLGQDKLLVLEQAKGEARLLVVNLRRTTNLLGRQDENWLEFELVGDELSKLHVIPAGVETWFSTRDLKGIDSDKLEGLAIVGPQQIALSNDNDFGLGDNVTGEPTKVWILHVNRPAP